MSNQSGRQFNISEAIEHICTIYLRDYLKSLYLHSIDNTDNIIEITGQRKKTDSGGFILIRIILDDENGEVLIPNIFLPQEDRGAKIGMGLLKMIFLMAEKFSYSLCLVNMTDSFYDKMLLRGAVSTSLDDALQIVKSTDLA